MKFTSAILGAAAVIGAVSAQDSSNQTLCAKYSAALFNTSNSTTQQTLLTALVNTAVIGNYMAGNKSVVTGIVNPGKTTSGASVNLLGYFNGSLVSTNRNGKAVAINFLDDGGATPLKENKPCSSGDNSKNQCKLLNHLYQYFGALLGCNAEGFPSYAGSTSQSAVHRYMNLDTNEVTYFIEQVGAAAASFGVSSEDITTVATTLSNVFNVRCAPAMKLPSTADTAYSQSVCLASDCKLANNSDCSASSDMSFPNGTNGVEPQRASASSSMSGSASGTSTGTAASGTSTRRPDSASMVSAVNAFGALALGAAGLVAITL